jgi:hypothetical protein
VGWQRRHQLQAGAERVGLGRPFGERFGAMKTEHLPRPRFGVPFVPEKRFDASGFVKKRQRAGAGGREKIGQAFGIVAGLLGDGAQEGPFLLGFKDAERFAIHEQKIIASPGLERDLAQSDAAPGGKVHFGVILDDPSRRKKLGVNVLARLLFGRHVWTL